MPKNKKLNEKVKTYLVSHKNLETMLFAGKEDYRPGINGLILDAENLVTVATDGHFMVVAPLDRNMLNSAPDWKKVVPKKPGKLRMAFNPSYLVELLNYWIKNVDKEDIVFEFYPTYEDGNTPMLKAENREKNVIALLTSRSIIE